VPLSASIRYRSAQSGPDYRERYREQGGRACPSLALSTLSLAAPRHFAGTP